MKYRIIITNSSQDVIYSGKPLDMPIKKDAIIRKSIELFGDEDPCIIHQSYAVQKLINDFIQSFHKKEVKQVLMKTIDYDYSFIDLDDLSQCYITLEV
ncbi:MAG: hypothetical protein NUK62_08665 [Tenericutes bacterium]|nr:hypothetical protein [Mycoplasmatota bacterium]